MSPLWLRPRELCHLAIKKVSEGGNTMQKHDGDRRRIITPQEARYTYFVAKRNRNVTPSQIVAVLAIATTHVSDRAVSLKLYQVCLYARKFVLCIPLQPHYRRERLC